MKFNIRYVCFFVLLAGCSAGYLDTAPENETGSTMVFETTEVAAMAVNGLAKLMNTAFYYPDIYSPKTTDLGGEGTIKMLYGNWMGNHFVCSNKDTYAALFKGTNYMSNTTSVYCYYPWWYYYMLIGNANMIIGNISHAKGTESERQRIRAQALTFRAYAYMMLVQVYCKRWSDSDEGEAEGLVLRLDNAYDPLGLSTMKEIYNQVYQDLDEAIGLFKVSGYVREKECNHLPDIHVAYAAYARTALNRQDYSKAVAMAIAAREGYELIGPETYCSGFNTPASEWIWSSYNSGSESIGQYAFFARIAYNSRISEASRTKCISKELYELIPVTDIRRKMFLDPGELVYSQITGKGGTDLDTKARILFPDIYATLPVYAYMQFKFKATDNTGAGDVNHFRSSEMYLIEAEADFWLGNEEEARKALVALTRNSGRDEHYDCTKTGEELLQEIKFYRAVELWGEGFDWFDMKRWGDTIRRKSFALGGNFTKSTGFVVLPRENNSWCWSVPDLETDYNPGI